MILSLDQVLPRRLREEINPPAPTASNVRVPGSGTAVDAENENCEDADGSWVVKDHVPAVGSKPCPETVPVPTTVTNPEPGLPPWLVMCELSKSNVNPSTVQKPEIVESELNDQ